MVSRACVPNDFNYVVTDRPGIEVVKGATAVFLDGPDPKAGGAVVLVNVLRARHRPQMALMFDALSLTVTRRPRPLRHSALTWAYVITESVDGRRLEPGLFDDELATVVREIEGSQLRASA